jgi:amino acid adenylation domain-containing protein/non-ribosomal peptide synthase protein (TIGR01720 family)
MRHPNVEAVAPLSPMQEGLLFHSLLGGEEGVYVNQHVIALSGRVDRQALERAWQTVVDRHQIFRASFHWEEAEKPLQIFWRQASLEWEYQDWRGETEKARAVKLADFLRAGKKRGFNLSRAPLMRLALLQFGDEDFRLCWWNHHLVLDGWSAAFAAREVFVAYAAIREGRAPELPPVAPFQRYLSWLSRQDLSQAQSFWNRTLEGYNTPASLDLGCGGEGAGYGQVSDRLTASQTETLTQFCARQGVTPAILSQAAWAVLIAKYSRHSDVVFGVTSSGRPADLADVESMVGLFINTLPMRIRFAADTPLISVLQQARDSSLETRAFEFTPLADIQKWSSVPRGVPLFESILVFENYPVDAMIRQGAGGLTIRNIEVLESTNYPLSITIGPGREFLLQFTYERARFTRAAIGRMLAHFRTVLEAFVDDPNRTLSDIAILTPAERRQILGTWQETARAYPTQRCLHEWIERQVEQSPDAPAVVAGDRVLTYSQLNAHANRLAHYLRALGAGPEIPVGVAMERSIEMMVALLAILKAGAAYVPLDPEYPAARLATILSVTRTSIVLAQRRFLHLLPSSLPHAVALDEDRSELASYPASNLPNIAFPDSPAYIIFTSGSTGQPKGVANTHTGICNRLLWMQEAFSLGPADTVLQKTPFSFDVSVWEFFWPLMTGARLVFARPGGHKDTGYLCDLIRHHGITTVHFVPPMLEAFLEDPAARSSESLKRIICSGEALPFALQCRFFAQSAAELHNLYGPTEAAVDVTWHVCERGAIRGPVPIGKPIANTRIYLLDRNMHPVPVGVPGELYIGGAGLARGYWSRPDLTAERFVPDPLASTPGARLYRTGDLARYREDGSIDYLGRLDFQIKLRGFRIEVGEIEDVFTSAPGVRQAAVVLREDSPGHKRLVAYVSGSSIDDVALRRAVSARLPDYMVPDEIVTLAELPLSGNGKIDRRALPAPEPAADRQTYVAPRDAEEELIAQHWSAVLGRDRVGVTENFLALGGDSILATRLVARLRAALQLDLPLRSLFDAPTVEELAEVVRELRAASTTPAPPITPAPPVEDYPLSYAQERLWFVCQWEAANRAYNIPLAVELEGRLDYDALQRSVDLLCARHEVLRMSFVSSAQGPRARIASTLSVPLTVEAVTSGAAEERISEEAARVFDLAQAPLLRCRLFRIAEDRHCLSIVIHHVIADGWSLEVLVRELLDLYGGADLARLPLQYKDYSFWQRNTLTNERLTLHMDHWKALLLPPPEPLDLPADWSLPREDSFRGATYGSTIPNVHAFARDNGATPFAVLLAAFAVLLSRFSGQRDFVIGTPVANRQQPGVEGLIGLFVNTLPLRMRLERAQSFRAVLKEASRVLLDALAHQDLPFEKLVETLRPAREPGRQPLFQTMLVLQEQPLARQRCGELWMQPRSVPSASAKFDLTLSLQESHDGFACSWEYNTDRFEESGIARIASTFERLVTAALSDPDRPWSSLPWLDFRETKRLAQAGRGPQPVLPNPALVHRVFESQSALTPEAPAVITGEGALTYRQLNRRANSVAHHLIRKGAGPETTIGLLMDRSLEMIVAILAVLKTGAAYVPLDPAYPEERRDLLAHDAGVVATLTHDDVCSFEGSDANPDVGVCPSGVACLMYTSGTTGVPKGVAITHEAIVRLVFGDSYADLSSGCRILHAAPPAFDASLFEIWGALVHGGSCVIAPAGPPSASVLYDLIQANRVDTAWFTASLFNMLVDERPEVFRGIGQVLTGGEALSLTHVRRFREIYPATRLINGYGPTESTTFTTCYTIPPALPSRLTSIPIGRPIAHTRVYVLDPEMQAVPIGVAGDLYAAGPGLARGYWNRPAQTAESFLPDPFANNPGERMYRTGDRARWLGDGALEFIGRADRQMKLHGHRIEPAEIEAVLLSCSGVRAAAIIAHRDRLIAYWVGGGPSPEERDLRAHVARSLPAYCVPAAFIQMEALPLTPSGKLDRAHLPEPAAASPRPFEPPRTPTERKLARAWSSALGLAEIGRHDSFFELGGDSLLSIRACARAAEEGLVHTVPDLFQYPTPAALATVLDSRVPASPRRDAPAAGPIPLSPSQHYFFDVAGCDLNHYNIAQLLTVRARPGLQRWREITRALAERHDSLRLRFHSSPDGWTAEVTDPPDEIPFQSFDLTGLSEAAQKAAIEAESSRLHTSLNLERGPLYRLVWFDLGAQRPGRLLALVHHLAADGSSLLPLLDDLTNALEENSRALAPLSTGWSDWVKRLFTYAQSSETRSMLPQWLDDRRRRIPGLPVDFPGGLNLQGSECEVVTRIPAPHAVPIPSLLLTALASALREWTGAIHNHIDWIAHGRDSLWPDLDVSRTAGYFSTRTPLVLDGEKPIPPLQTLSYGCLRYLCRDDSVREQISNMPKPEISVNYLGNIGRLWRPNGLLSLAEENPGPARSPAQRRACMIHIFADLTGGDLRVVWKYSSNAHRRETIERLAALVADNLRPRTATANG